MICAVSVERSVWESLLLILLPVSLRDCVLFKKMILSSVTACMRLCGLLCSVYMYGLPSLSAAQYIPGERRRRTEESPDPEVCEVSPDVLLHGNTDGDERVGMLLSCLNYLLQRCALYYSRLKNCLCGQPVYACCDGA